MQIPFDITAAADLLEVSIQDIWMKVTNLTTYTDYQKYYNTETGAEYYEKDSSISGLGLAAYQPDNAAAIKESPIEGYDKTYTQEKHSKIIPFTEDMWRFGIKQRHLEGIPAELRRSCAAKREKNTADQLNNSFATSYTDYDDEYGNRLISTSGGDSVAYFSASHTNEGGGSNWNNIVYDGSTYNMDFDYDALEAAHKTSTAILDPKEMIMDIKLDTLVCKLNSTVHRRAEEILNMKKKPGTADNDNASGVTGFKLLPLRYLTNDTAYWMFDSSLKNNWYGLQYKQSQDITLYPQDIVYETGEIRYRAMLSYQIGANDMRNWVGSTGLNA